VTQVDAAFRTADGTEWLVGRRYPDVCCTFVKEPGGAGWVPRDQAWGAVRNTFADPAKIDAAFVDDDGRTYLFCGDQYVRYSGTGYGQVDEGFPRPAGAWWEGDERGPAALPVRFRAGLDAAFQGVDGSTYLFAGDSYLTAGAAAGAEQPIAGHWGEVRNELAATGRVDAAYADGTGAYLFSGDQVVRYTGAIENGGVLADPGWPRRIAAHAAGIPAEFGSGVEAAFTDPAGVLHLFRDGRTVAIGPDGTDGWPGSGGAPRAVPTADRWGALGPVLPSGGIDAAFVGLDGRTYLFSGERYLRCSGTDYSTVDTGWPRAVAADWAGLRQVDVAFVLDGTTHLFGTGGHLFDLPDPTGELAAALDAGRLPRAVGDALGSHGITVPDGTRPAGSAPDWQLTADGIVLALRRPAGTLEVHSGPDTAAKYEVRYSTRDYGRPDAGYPRPLADNWWNLPDAMLTGESGFGYADAVLTARDGLTYLFAGEQYAVFDGKRRWWSEPRPVRDAWGSLPFDRVDAAFVGRDGRTYLFNDGRYARWSTADHTEVDDRYPAPITPFWGNVANTIARTGRVDAALVVPAVPAGADPVANPAIPVRTYLFAGGQYVRYTGTPYGTADDGYPASLADLAREPGFGNLVTALDRVDAAYADRGNISLFSGSTCHVVSATAYRRYDGLDIAGVTCAFLEDGVLVVQQADGWYRHSAIEATGTAASPHLPRVLRTVPPAWQSDVDAVLSGVDGDTYLFKGAACYNTGLGREYPLADEWGRPRNTVYHTSTVDAAFAGTDGRTYVFSGDQFVSYAGTDYLDAPIETGPLPVAEHWGGLTAVTLAFVRGSTTYLVEPPDPAGTARYLTYSGTGYAAPDGPPQVLDRAFWEIPDRYVPGGWTIPDAVLVDGDSSLFVLGDLVVQRNDTTGAWAYPRPLDRIWPGLSATGLGASLGTGLGTGLGNGLSNGQTAGPTGGLSAAFTGRDGATYFFAGPEFVRWSGGTAGPREQIRLRWGRSRNNFLAAGGTVDAALVQGGVTYLFSGDQYARYSGPDYQYADAGYPKPIAPTLRTEAPFRALPAAFDEAVRDRTLAGARSVVDAAVANDRTVHLLVGGAWQVASRAPAASYDVAGIGRIRNTVADQHRVEAALVAGGRTYLFCGDQYVRYSGPGYDRVDESYPREIADALAPELGLATLPAEFRYGLDAAFQGRDGYTYLFAGRQYLRADGDTANVLPVAGAWGVVPTQFRPGGPIDAALVGPAGEVYAFAGGQYVRYPAGAMDTVEPGFPRTSADDWGDLPAAFEQGIDGAFALDGRTYLCREAEYVRYSGAFDAVDRTLPQPFRHRFADAADYRIGDVAAITRFVELARAHPDGTGGLATFLLPGPATFADPYAYLAGLFGWDAAELRWCRRHSPFLTDGAADEGRFELEFLLELVDLFAFTGPLGTGPSTVYAEVWTNLYADGSAAGLDAAAAALSTMLARRSGPQEWTVLSGQIHDELNVAARDALVARMLSIGTGAEPAYRTARELFDRFLVDVQMGGRGRTSRVREAIAATQLFLQRYLLRLEEVAGPAAADGDGSLREQLAGWWSWMRNYRVWEANRKVFLYPENYLRPELRPSRTPAFRSLQSDLLQGEITADAVEAAYKRYLDEYTEVSRLTIAGGYVYTKDQDPDGPRRLVVFGRTKTDPRRYYFRRAEFASQEKLSASWEPWQKVDVQIDADLVHPVHAFGRVFVFWTVTEPVPPAGDGSTAKVEVRDEAGGQQVSGRAKTQRVRISFSFGNLNGEWVPAQNLGTGASHDGVISDITMLARPVVRDTPDDTSVLVSCSYTLTPTAEPGVTEPPAPQRIRLLFDLNPELYVDDLLDDADQARTAEGTALLADLEAAADTAATADRVAQIFVDPVKAEDVVRFDLPHGLESWPWFSVDLKGGSFLCRPVLVPGSADALRPLLGNTDQLPVWQRVDAAVELPGGTRYFFDNRAHRYTTGSAGTAPSTLESIGARWGRRPTVLADAERDTVDAVFVRGNQTFVCTGDSYLRFTGTPFQWPDQGYPRPLHGNPDRLPEWPRIDAAFVDTDGTEYFFRHNPDQYVVSGALDNPRPGARHWSRIPGDDGFGPVDTALQTDGGLFLLSGDRYLRYSTSSRQNPDGNRPRLLAGNKDSLPTDLTISAAAWKDGTAYFFDNVTHSYTALTSAGRVTRPYRPTPSRVQAEQAVDAAWVGNGALFLTRGQEYVRYTLAADGTVPAVVDDGYPRPLQVPIDTAFTRGGQVYLFSGGKYARADAGQDPDTVAYADLRSVPDAWRDLPLDGIRPFDAALAGPSALILFAGDQYVRHATDAKVPRPYELAGLPFEIIRLTTGTASVLNRRLLGGGLPALLDLSTQQTDELTLVPVPEPPAGEPVAPAPAGTVRVRQSLVDESRLPTASHVDFNSANGLYYWEIFFHAPLLIAQALNTAQRFEDAKRWYEYVFDPTDPESYWRFLPFVTADLAGLADSIDYGVARVGEVGASTRNLAKALKPVLAALRMLAPAAAAGRHPVTADERAALDTLGSADVQAAVASALAAVRVGTDPAKQAAVATLAERTAELADLGRQFDVLGDRDGLLAAYRDDPFEPHAIAALRPVAYRRTVVMSYVDNLLDWADMLFRQYTAESVDEARMLYVLAFDLLGDEPAQLGTQLLPAARSFGELAAEPGDLDLLGFLTSGGTLVDGPGAVHAGVASEYFTVPQNTAFADYWTRVEDRLHKIRESLDILGISQPLPLFDPPLDPMALVSAVGAGVGVAAAAAGASVPPPPYRFTAVYARAQDLVGKLQQLGGALLNALERRDAEELSLLQGRQEREILDLTRAMKAAQVRIAEETLAELTAGRTAAEQRVTYYQGLIDGGLSALEQAQIGLMATAATAHLASSVLKVAAAIAYAVPQVKAGPFIIGVETGGRQLGDTIDRASGVAESIGEGLSVVGEILGIRSQHDRSAQDWQLGLQTAQSDVVQIGHQVTGAQQQLAIARKDAEILERQLTQSQAIADFMRLKFGTAELYSWMSEQLGGLYFRAYGLAYDTARSAERAFAFEQGLTDAEVSHIQPTYWDSRRKGLLAGESLAVDLDSLGKAYADANTRGMEITRQVSLLVEDPLALLRLRSAGRCEFSLGEALFDYDFPGHYRRQIRTVSVTFVDGDGQSIPVNATLTQLGHKTVLSADPKAVQFLLAPTGQPPESLRSDWRPSQRIALSEVDNGQPDSGLFELRMDDERYLPFEGTGAVSSWRLELSSRAAEPYDVIVTVKYTAEHGGETFGNAVKGMLKPYATARYVDVAREFPDEWAAFLAGADLALPLAPELFPGMSSRRIGAVLAAYQRAGADGARLVLAGAPLPDQTLVQTPDLTIGAGGTPPVSFTADGERASLVDVGLVLTYQARVR
jgi:Tc toxin complex TcA C-terminal TcB-binding domain/Neuraminidase-like domain/Hemopexin